jgi:DNA-binding NtrC family response regulator
MGGYPMRGPGPTFSRQRFGARAPLICVPIAPMNVAAMSSCHLTSSALLRQPPGSSSSQGRGDWALLGESVAVRRLRSQIRRVAPYFHTALIRGEAGSGKECVARALHAFSPAAEEPFIVADARLLAESVDCGEVSRLHFTHGAAGALESAQGGTLYLTRVGELSLSHQTALLRFLQQRAARLPSGRGRTEDRQVRLDERRNPTTRILAASDRDLRTLAAIGQFHEDLYTSLSGVEILVPPLRQRIDDIPALVEWLLRRLGEEGGRSSQLFAESAMVWLQQHPWPNNLRELERVVAEAAALTEGGAIEARHLLTLVEPELAESAGSAMLKSDRLHDVMQRHVLDLLTRCGGNKVRAAELLGISRSTLYRMLSAKSASGSLLVG